MINLAIALRNNRLKKTSPSDNEAVDESSAFMKWPTCGSTPISEFTTEGYWTQAFPTLFPTGAGDFRSPRVRSVTLADYLKHLMRYKDGRFAQHPRFRYFALNTLMRWRALETSRVCLLINGRLLSHARTLSRFVPALIQ